MKKLFFFLVLFLSYPSLSGQTINPESEPDSCSPTFKDIYDFQVGDAFQFVYESWNSAGGTGYNNKTTSKYTIISKSILADTLVYSIDGIERREFYCDVGPWPGCEYQSSFKFYQNTLRYIDSANHFLNKCDNELILIYDEGAFGSEIYTRVKIQTENSNRVKNIGGENNLFEYNEEDSLIEVNYIINYKQVFEKNLGKIEFSEIIFESSDHRYLQGYIKNGDTTGIISLDQDLMISAIDAREHEAVIVYPNPTTGILFFLDAEAVLNSSVEIFDVKGMKVTTRKIREASLDMRDLNKGIYFLKIISDQNSVLKKVIIE